MADPTTGQGALHLHIPPPLRDYQARALQATLRAIQTSLAVLAVLPTGAGKSWLIAALVWELTRAPGASVIVVTHRRELVAQNTAILKRYAGVEPAVFGASFGRREIGRITFAQIQSLANLPIEQYPRNPAALIIDEAHRLPPDGNGHYRTVLARLRELQPELRVIGLTATPFRGDGTPLVNDGGALCST